VAHEGAESLAALLRLRLRSQSDPACGRRGLQNISPRYFRDFNRRGHGGSI